MSRIIMNFVVAFLFAAAFPVAALCEDKPGDNGGGTPPEDVKPAGGEGQPEKTDAQRKEDFQKRKDSFFKMFKDNLEEMEQSQDDPEKEEIARLTDVRDDYNSNLKKAQIELDRSKEVVKQSFVGLIKSDQNKETIEQRCENIWLDYMATSRKSKMQINEYERAMKGVDNRIRYIKHRLATREYPTAEKGEKYYLSDPIELYEEGQEQPEFDGGPPKSQISYYALLKDFVMGILGKGRADMSVIARRLSEPDLYTMFEAWNRRAESRKEPEPSKESKN